MKNLLLILLLFLSCASSALGQSDATTVESALEEVSQDLGNEEKRIKRLEELTTIINTDRKNLTNLRKKINPEIINFELNQLIEQKTQDLEVVTKSFEQIAIGGIDLDIFEQEESPKTWQEELTILIKPLLENLRGLTEKARKRESLKQAISTQKSAIQTAELAVLSIEKLLTDNTTEKAVKQQLVQVKEKWQSLLNEAQRKQELANIELSNLNDNDSHWFETFKSSVKNFAQDRGLTLLMAFSVAIAIIILFRFITRLIELKRTKHKRAANRTTLRVVVYAQKLLTVVFVIVGILIVFFIRGDVLLLALMSIILFTAALGLRHFIPQFIEESRLLLNIGRVRENELVFVNGVPWRVASINVFSKLINPEIRGIIRVPLEDMKALVSRPINDEKWFPSSIGDWVIDEQNHLYEVISQGPDAVELQSAQGTNKLMPTSQYYSAGYVNLTKSKGIRITSEFGVDYNLQSISLDEVPEKMCQNIQSLLLNSDLDTEEIFTRVELHQAGASSLDYLIIVNINSKAAKHYYLIGRLIQQACVDICNKEGWSIPFPQMTIHRSVD